MPLPQPTLTHSGPFQPRIARQLGPKERADCALKDFEPFFGPYIFAFSWHQKNGWGKKAGRNSLPRGISQNVPARCQTPCSKVK